MDKSISQHHSQQFSKTTKALTGDANDNGKCSHKVIMKDMCCICGRNLRPEGGFSGERNEPTTANVSMIHHVPELVVSKEIADELGARDHENILRQRRLILLLDLDQTLVHTANRPLRAEEMGASDLTVYRLNGCTFCTKIRPNTRKLLDHLNNLFEMHIVTFGQRMYAHKIAELLDPQRKYFDYRILSRDELLSSMHKTGNLKALFPCSEQMILMLDDRPDVWMHSDALIRVKPYRFFMEVGDINAPPQELLDSVETSDGLDKARNLGEEELKEESAHRQLLLKDGEENAQTKEREQTTDEKTMAKSASESGMAENRPETVERTLTEPIGAIVDEDNALVHVERVLSEVHSLFYQQYDKDKKIPDVKRILAWLRFQVLCGEHIVFSGIIPLGVDVKACEIYRMCTRFGAKVGDRIVERKTTVLVAARAATEKFRHAQRLRIPIVSTLWLDACFERWQRVDKRDFLFREEDEQQTSAPSGESKFNEQEEGAGLRKRMAENKTAEMAGSSEEAAEVKRHRLSSISLCLDEKMDHFAQMDTISTKTLHEMESEVDSVLSDGDENDDNEDKTNDDGESSTTSADYSETGEAFTVDSDRRNEEETGREFTDYGDEDTTRDSTEQDDEDGLYDELADDLEEQMQGQKRDERFDEEGTGNG
uniref:RNA polymerase II subunit A C-terminal domain phosphatase n=1 Tax=Globodera rostochiensis TaxID=31243 RepID=A0A914H277_GLORO